jgi:hypothetical protein
MTDQPRGEYSAHSPSTYPIDYPGSPDTFGCSPHEPGTIKNSYASSDERSPHHALEPFTTQSWSAPTGAVGPRLLEKPLYDSPSSTSSSISSPETVPTPTYTDFPVYATIDPLVSQHVHVLANNEAWSTELEPLWRLSQPIIPPWGSQQFWSPSHGGSGCEKMSLAPLQDYPAQSGISASSACISYHPPVLVPAAGIVQSAPFAVSDNSSDSESGGSESDLAISSTCRRSRANSKVIKLGKWTMTCKVSTASRTRLYPCPLRHTNHADTPCPKRFGRPEHLRRHINTVHGNERCHPCKVCSKKFSRGDNLQEHYLTHLERGGRAGNNKKISLATLETILGQKERPLLKRLKTKLDMQRAKNVKTKSSRTSRGSLHSGGIPLVAASFVPLLPDGDRDW